MTITCATYGHANGQFWPHEFKYQSCGDGTWAAFIDGEQFDTMFTEDMIDQLTEAMVDGFFNY
jgi:hypothetical protein